MVATIYLAIFVIVKVSSTTVQAIDDINIAVVHNCRVVIASNVKGSCSITCSHRSIRINRTILDITVDGRIIPAANDIKIPVVSDRRMAIPSSSKCCLRFSPCTAVTRPQFQILRIVQISARALTTQNIGIAIIESGSMTVSCRRERICLLRAATYGTAST